MKVILYMCLAFAVIMNFINALHYLNGEDKKVPLLAPYLIVSLLALFAVPILIQF